MESLRERSRADLERLAVRAMQAGIAALLAVGLALPSPRVSVNAALALLVTFLPALLRRDRGVVLGPRVTLWLTGTLLLHTVGMAGAYDVIHWWDHLTHVLSASLVAAVGYAGVRAVDRHSEALALTPAFLAVFLLLFTLALGVLWELLEYAGRLLAAALGVDPVLVQYGLGDTMLDLVFDAAGAVVVAALGARRLGGVVDSLAAALGRTRSADGK